MQGVEKEQLGDRIRGDNIKALVPLVDSFEAAQNSVKAETENEQKINAAYQASSYDLLRFPTWQQFKYCTVGIATAPLSLSLNRWRQ